MCLIERLRAEGRAPRTTADTAEDMPQKRVMYVQYTNPAAYPPLQHSSRILAERGFEVLFLGSGAQGASSLAFPFHPKIRVKQLRFCEAGWRQKLHYATFVLWTLLWVLLWRPRWI